MASSPFTPKFLVIGYRKGLVRTLQRLGWPYFLWADQVTRTDIGALHTHKAPIVASEQTVTEALRVASLYGPYDRVVATGEGGVLAAAIIREKLGVPGISAALAMRCLDKLLMKQFLSDCGIPMTRFVDPSGSSRADVDLPAILGLPIVIKGRLSSGSRSFHLCTNSREIREVGLGNTIAEAHIDAAEMSVETFIQAGHIRFQNLTEYYEKKHINVIPAPLSPETQQKVLSLNKRVIQALGLKNCMTHLEVYLTKNGPLFGEVAIRPPGGHIMELIELVYGFDSWEAFLTTELERPYPFPDAPLQHGSVTLIHPGPGRIRAIEGWHEVTSLPQICRPKLRVTPGETLEKRQGTGQECGHYFATAPTREQLIWVTDKARSLLSITLDETG